MLSNNNGGERLGEILASLSQSKPHETADGRYVEPQPITEEFAEYGILPAIAPSAPPQVPLPFRDVSTVGGYRTLYYNKTRRRLESKDLTKAENEISTYLDRLRLLKNFDQYFSSYDREVILPITCGLGVISPGHFDLDEKGQFGRFGNDRTYLFPQDVFDAAVAHFVGILNTIPVAKEGTLSMKRGTNLGWPTQKGGRARDEGDCLLALHVAYAVGCRLTGYSLEQAVKKLEGIHGEAYAVAGERLQHTERLIPWMGTNFAWQGWNLQPRVRGIYFSPKFCVAWNRPEVKRMLSAFLKSPLHIQDRPTILARTSNWKKQGWWTTSVDVGRFDHSFGGDAGRQAIRVCASALGQTGFADASKVYADWNVEFSMPDLISTNKSVYQTKGGEILSSGTSMTSLVNTSVSHMIIYEMVKTAFPDVPVSKFDSFREKDWDAMSWGDDVILAINPRSSRLGAKFRDLASRGGDDDAMSAILTTTGDRLQIKLDVEPTLKWLGTNYDMKSFTDASTGLPLGRFIQQQIFPERGKVFPVDLIGLAARLLLLDAPVRSVAFDAVRPLLQESLDAAKIKMGLSITSPESLLNNLEAFQIYIQKDASLTQEMDSVLQIFAKGMDPSDLELSGDFSVFSSLLGVTSADVSDPAAYLSSLETPLPNDFISHIREIQCGRVDAWLPALTKLAWYFGGNFVRPGDCYY